MEHNTPEGLAHGYYCMNCGRTTNMYGTGHAGARFNDPWICEANPERVKALKELNK